MSSALPSIEPRRARIGALAVVFLALAAIEPRAAQAQVAARTITREDALRLGADNGPGVASASAPLPAIGLAQSASRSLFIIPPRLTLSMGERYGSFGSGFEFQATGLIDVPLRPVGSARETAANALHDTVALDVQRARQDAALRAAIAWSRALEGREVLRLRSASLVAAQSVVQIADKRVGAGVGMPSEAALARGDAGAAKASMLDAEGYLVDALAELRLAIGVSQDTAIEVGGDLESTGDVVVDESAALAEAMLNNPSVGLAKAKATSAKADVSVVSASFGPVFGVGASFYRDGIGDKIFAGILSIPLPFTDPAGFDRARTTIAADVAQAEVVRTENELRKDVAVALHDRKHTREVRDALRTEAVEPLRAALKQALTQYDTGTADVTLVLFARQRAYAVEEQLAHANAEVLRADLRYVRVVGRKLVP